MILLLIHANHLEKIPEPTELDCTLKVKWKRKKHTFTESDLEAILSPIGKVDSIALSEKKKGSALVVFKTVVDAVSDCSKYVSHEWYSNICI